MQINCFRLSAARSKHIKYTFRNALGFIKRTYRREGFSALYRGNTATLARIIPYSACQFASFEQFRRLLKVDEAKDPHLLRFLAGSLAGITSQSVTYPLDLARARMAITDKCGYKWVSSRVTNRPRWHADVTRTPSYLLSHLQKHMGGFHVDLYQREWIAFVISRVCSDSARRHSLCRNIVLYLRDAEAEIFREDRRDEAECNLLATFWSVCRNLWPNKQLSVG